MPTNIAERYSQVSPLNTTVVTQDRLLIAQPITPGDTEYKVVTIEVGDVYQYIKNKIQNEGISLIAEIGEGISGNGSITDPLGLDEDWFDSLNVRKDRLEMTIVGDRSFPELPLSGSYFSASYPYDTGKQTSTGFLEANGDLRLLNPVTNGEVVRYTYSVIPNWLANKGSGSPVAGLLNSDTVYQPVGLNANEFVSHVFNAGTTAMIIEITDSVTGDISHAFVKLNGTLVYTQHSLIRLGTNLIDVSNYPTPSTRVICHRTRPPAAAVFKGKNYVFVPTHISLNSGVDIFCYEVADNGTLTEVTNWHTTSPVMSSINSAIHIADVGITNDSGVANAEVYLNPENSLSSAVFSAGIATAYNQLGLSLVQNKDKLRLVVIRNDYFNNGSTFFYTNSWPLDITFGVTNLAETPDTIGGGAVYGNSNLTTIDWSGPIFNSPAQYVSISQTHHHTFLADGSVLLGSAATSNTMVARTYMRRNLIPEFTSYEIGDLRATYPASYSGAQTLRGVLPAITPITGRSSANFLSSGKNGVSGYLGSLWLNYSSFSSEVKAQTEADVKGNLTQTDTGRWTLIDGNTYAGFEMNNDRITRPELDITSIFSYQDANGNPSHGNYWWKRFFTSTDNDSNGTVTYDETNEWIVDSRRNVIRTLTIDPAVKTALENQLLTIFTSTLIFRLAVVPDPTSNKLVIAAAGLKPGDGGHWCQYGVFTYTYTDNGNERTITGISFDETKLTNPLHVRAIAYKHNYTAGYFGLSGLAMQLNSDGGVHYIVKEGVWTGQANGAGSGTVGNYYITYDESTGQNTYVRNQASPDNSTSVIFPTIGPLGLGLGSIDGTAGAGTFYLFKPIVEATPTLTPTQQAGVVLSAMQPSKVFSVIIGSEIYVILDGVETQIPPQVFDLSTITATPANRTFYFYLVSNGISVSIVVSLTTLHESFTRTLFAVVTTGAETVENIVAKPFTRLGLYRISQVPIGTSAPATVGSAANYPINYWLTGYYQT